MKSTTVLLALFFSAVLAQGQVATTPKVVAVDIEMILKNYTKLQSAQTKLESSKKNAQQEIEILKDEGRKLVEKARELEARAKNPALSPTAVSQAKDELQKLTVEIKGKEQELLEYVKRTDATLKQRFKSMLELHMGEIRNMVAVIAKEKGADLALNKSLKDFVLYSADYFDITQAVLGRLNSVSSK
jgi:Skp family chaperone for outer membrane proteins